MAAEARYVVVGLARARAEWFREVTSWANQALIPVEFLKAIGAAEARARLAGSRAVSALLVDASAPGLDRSLIATAHQVGAVVIVADAAGSTIDWIALGAVAVLPTPFTAEELTDAIRRHCPTPEPARAGGMLGEPITRPRRTSTFRGQLTAVIGGGGSGTSTVAMAVAQALSDRSPQPGDVLLADLALRAHQAMYHDTRDVIPGLQELIEAHRRGGLGPAAVRELTYRSDERGYRLLLGLRRSRDWTALRAEAVRPAIESLLGSFRQVIADIDVDLDGEPETGSADVDDRSSAARLAVESADRVVVVIDASMKGIHDGGSVVRDVARHRGDGGEIVVVVNRSPRRRSVRAEIASTLAELIAPVTPPLSPVFLSSCAALELDHRTGSRLPNLLTEPLAAALELLNSKAPTVSPLVASGTQ